VLSNAIAWLSVGSLDFRILFNNRTVGLATHSGGGGQKVLLAMRQQLFHLGCTVLGREVLATPPEASQPRGRLSKGDSASAARPTSSAR
jgi:chromate reductase